MSFQTEKTLNDLGDKVSDSEKSAVNDAIAKLKSTVATGDSEAIKADTEALQKAFYPIAERIYQSEGGADAQGAQGAQGDGNYYGSDSDFEDKTNG